MSTIKKSQLTTLERRALNASDDARKLGSITFNVIWTTNRDGENCAGLYYEGLKCAYASGSGYDKISQVLAEFLKWVMPGLLSFGGCGLRHLTTKAFEEGWVLEQTYETRTNDGFKLTRRE